MKWHEKRFRSVISPPYRRRYYDGLSMLAVAWRGAVSRVRRKLRSDWEKWAWNNEDTLAVALHFVFCPHARHSTTKVTTSRCCGKITRRESICWQLAPREELSLLSCQIHSHQLRGYCQHSLLRKLCAKLGLLEREPVSACTSIGTYNLLIACVYILQATHVSQNMYCYSDRQLETLTFVLQRCYSSNRARKILIL